MSYPGPKRYSNTMLNLGHEAKHVVDYCVAFEGVPPGGELSYMSDLRDHERIGSVRIRIVVGRKPAKGCNPMQASLGHLTCRHRLTASGTSRDLVRGLYHSRTDWSRRYATAKGRPHSYIVPMIDAEYAEQSAKYASTDE